MNTMLIQEGWFGLWYRIHAQGHNGWTIFFDLIQHYAEPHRYYHDFTHIMQVLKEFKSVRNLCVNPDAVEMALWTHHVIYQTGDRNNETRSATWTSEMLRNARLPDAYREEVIRLILLKNHNLFNVKEDNDGAFFTDIDLSILGQSPAVFGHYDRHTWKEWVWERVVSEDEYISERAEFLTTFVNRRIYSTPYFKRKYENQAKKNIRKSIAQLKAKIAA